MSNIRLFYSKSLSLNLTDKLDKSQSHYVSKVMRLKQKEVFSLFNSSGEWEAKISNITKSIVEFNVTKQLRHKENTKDLWLAFSPIKSNYFNFMIQKATELGVTKFLPVIFERTIVRKINKERLEKVIIEAAEQSNRITVPSIEDPQKLKSFLNKDMDLIFTDLNTTNTKIDIEDGGIVTIASHDGAAAEEAQKIIEGLTRKVHEGEIFSGVVTRIIPIGAFVEILPGKEGMVHISQLSEARGERVEDVVRQGDEVTVRVREIDSRGRINLTLRGVGQNNGMSYPEPTPTPVAPLN